MFNLFQFREKKRIKELFRLFKTQIRQGVEENTALMRVWGELKMQNICLKDKYGFKERDISSKKNLLREMFTPLDVADYDIFKSIEFIVCWEFPHKYNHTPTIQDIRSGKDSLTILENKIKEIGQKILKGINFD
jgi:hypothetical protein